LNRGVSDGVTRPVRDPVTDRVAQASVNRRRRPSLFTHGGPRKGVTYDLLCLLADSPGLRAYRDSYPLRLVAAAWGLTPTNLYYRLYRHKIPYVVGPGYGGRREVRVPAASLPAVEAMLLGHLIGRGGLS